MHSNWKALSTVDFKRTVFVRPTPEADPEQTRDKNTQLGATLDGSEIRKFYENVLASEKVPEPAKRKHSNKGSSNIQPKKLIQVRNEFKEKSDQPSSSNLNLAFLAAQNNDQDALKQLLDRDPHLLTARDNYGWTLLMVAACQNADKVVSFLMKQEKIDAKACDKSGHNAAHLARKRGLKNIADLIESAKKEGRNKRSKIEASTYPDETKSSFSQTTSNHFNCELCEQSFNSESVWKKHLTSIMHQMKESEEQVEAGTLQHHYVIPEANKGFQIMLGAGWDKKGLGPSGSGKLYPVKTIHKTDRTGLGLAENQGTASKPKVTHFEANDVASVQNPIPRVERAKTLSKKARAKLMNKDRRKEVDFRREFVFD